MRQGQQNRRGRGRNNQNNQQRKGQNPLTRSFESNGPDVKLRGTPAHIAEKYMSLARDALSAGDPVLAENYLQHAEHYNRIIMAYREQQVSQGGGDPGYSSGYNPMGRGEGGFGSDMDGGEPGFEGAGDPLLTGRPGVAEQPRMTGEGGERRFDERGQRPQGQEPRHQSQGLRDRDRSFQEGRGGFDRRDRQDRFERPDRGEQRMDRDRPDRDRADRDRPDRDRGDRDRPERFERPQPHAGSGELRSEGGLSPRRRDRPAGDRLPQETHEQPEFLRRPVRRPRREDQDEGREGGPAPVVAAGEDTD